MKMRPEFYLTAVALLVPLLLPLPSWPADAQAADAVRTAPSVRQTTPQTPAARPGVAPSQALTGETQGKLSSLGGKVTLHLSRNITRMEVLSGRTKLATLGAGISFDVTPYLSRAGAKGLTFHYYDSGGSRSVQVFSSSELQALAAKTHGEQRGAGTTPPPPPDPPGAARGRATAADPLDNSLSRSGMPGQPGVREDITSPRKAGANLSAAGGPVSTASYSSIEVTSPKQGDYMVEGGQFALQWSAYGSIPEKCVNIDLFQGIYHIGPIVKNVCVDGFNWHLPPGMSGTGYKVRIRTVDNSFSDDSDPFSIITAQPDLRITNLHILPANPDMRDEITVAGVIVNTGYGTSGPTTFRVFIPVFINSAMHTLDLPSLPFGQYSHHPFSQNIGMLPEGTTEVTATVTVDPQDLVTEADEDNNSVSITRALAPLPNLQPTVSSEVRTDVLKKTEIHFTIHNNSSIPIGPFVCRTWVEKKGHKNHNVPGIPPYEARSVKRTETFALAGWRGYSITADYGDNVRESRETDNVATGRIHAKSVLKVIGVVP